MHSRTCLFAFLLFLASLRLTGQADTCGITGQVLDGTERAVADATITIWDEASGTVRRALTDESGFYRIVGLLPGIYRVAASAPQLEAGADSRVVLHVGMKRQVDFQLAPRTRRESVVVVERVQSLPSDSAMLGSVLTRERPYHRRVTR